LALSLSLAVDRVIDVGLWIVLLVAVEHVIGVIGVGCGLLVLAVVRIIGVIGIGCGLLALAVVCIIVVGWLWIVSLVSLAAVDCVVGIVIFIGCGSCH